MALPQISPSDFIGFYKISIDEFTTAKLQNWIDQFLPIYVRDIIGASGYTAMVNQDRQKWVDLSNGKDYTNESGVVEYFPGLKSALLGFIFFEYIRDNAVMTVAGSQRNKGELSDRPSPAEISALVESRWNRGLPEFNATLKGFLKANEDYSEVVISSAEAPVGTYTLDIADTTYIETGDTVTIEGVEYPLINVVADTSIEINAATGQDFTGLDVEWKPYEEVNQSIIDIVGI